MSTASLARPSIPHFRATSSARISELHLPPASPGRNSARNSALRLRAAKSAHIRGATQAGRAEEEKPSSGGCSHKSPGHYRQGVSDLDEDKILPDDSASFFEFSKTQPIEKTERRTRTAVLLSSDFFFRYFRKDKLRELHLPSISIISSM
ncbi:hypothetical protein Nepgr_028426 [Nepenthes gracilis]|uniref:Uncharacterized protein n=1 Tax=Nepenthes gracilis TaxID=150966 RepID=A0AAD3TAN1_NEPGR|nr:hypothetical protein Nepgr_028426 [Nepenthes gracilis]